MALPENVRQTFDGSYEVRNSEGMIMMTIAAGTPENVIIKIASTFNSMTKNTEFMTKTQGFLDRARALHAEMKAYYDPVYEKQQEDENSDDNEVSDAATEFYNDCLDPFGDALNNIESCVEYLEAAVEV